MAELLKDRYEPLETLGIGGTGRVVKAVDHQHSRLVALKIRTIRNTDTQEALLAETRMLLAVAAHPALPLVRDDFFDGDDYVVAMDWVDGIDLATLLRDRGRPGLAAVECPRLPGGSGRGADASSRPRPAGDPRRCQAGKPNPDQGRARSSSSTSGCRRCPTVCPAEPTPRTSRAPELAGGGAPSHVSDVYGLAATALALLTGSPPAAGSREWDGIDATQAEQLEDVIRRGLATDPARRPATPAELVERLREAGGRPCRPACSRSASPTSRAPPRCGTTTRPAMAEALVRHDELIAEHVESNGGQLIESMGEGDSTVSVFHSAPQAIEAALAANRALAAESWPHDLAIVVRFGLHTGEAERRGHRLLRPHAQPRRARARAGRRRPDLPLLGDREPRRLPPSRGLRSGRPRAAPAQGLRDAGADLGAPGAWRRRAPARRRLPVPRAAGVRG